MTLQDPGAGYTPRVRILHAPLDVAIVESADGLSMMGAAASGFSTGASSALFGIGKIAPMVGWYHWPGHPLLGGQHGAWFQSALARVVGVRADDSVDVIRVYASGADVTNSGVLTSAATGTPGVLFAKDDLVLTTQDEGGKRFVFPGQIAIVADGVTLGSGAGNFSTRIRRASGAGLETTTASGLSPVERPLNDVIGVFDAPIPDVAGGETKPSQLAGLVMFQDEGATAGYSQRVRIGTPDAGGFLTDVMRYQNTESATASGLAIRTDAEYWLATTTAPSTTRQGGPLNFYDNDPALSISVQLASGASTGAPTPPWAESQLVLLSGAQFGPWRIVRPAVTVITSGAQGHVTSPHMGGLNRRWSDVLTFASTNALAIKHTAALSNPSTGSSAVLNSIIRVAPDRTLGALNITSGVVFDANVDTSKTRYLRQTFRTGTADNPLGATMSGTALNASGFMWTSGGVFAVIGHKTTNKPKIYSSSVAGVALGFFVAADSTNAQTQKNSLGSGIETINGTYWRPAIPIPWQGPIVVSINLSGGAGVSVAAGNVWGTAGHYKYLIGTALAASGGVYYSGYVHNLATGGDILKSGTRVLAWYHPQHEDWYCCERGAGL